MARNEEKQLTQLNRLHLQKLREEELEKNPPRPQLKFLNTAAEIKKWLPSIKDDLRINLAQSQVGSYTEKKISEYRLEVDRLQKEYMAFIRKLKNLDPKSEVMPWTERGYKKRHLTDQETEDETLDASEPSQSKRISLPILEKECNQPAPSPPPIPEPPDQDKPLMFGNFGGVRKMTLEALSEKNRKMTETSKIHDIGGVESSFYCEKNNDEDLLPPGIDPPTDDEPLALETTKNNDNDNDNDKHRQSLNNSPLINKCTESVLEDKNDTEGKEINTNQCSKTKADIDISQSTTEEDNITSEVDKVEDLTPQFVTTEDVMPQIVNTDDESPKFEYLGQNNEPLQFKSKSNAFPTSVIRTSSSDHPSESTLASLRLEGSKPINALVTYTSSPTSALVGYSSSGSSDSE